MRTTILAATMILAFGSTSAYAAQSHGQFDGNQNDVVDADELQPLAESMIDQFDEDDTAGLSTSEMHRLVFHFWDRNDDGGISHEEFIRPGDWDTKFDALDFTRYDVNDDEVLSETEFNAFNAPEMYASWDVNADETIDEGEFALGLVEVMNTDDEPGLTAEEFSEIPATL